MNSNCSKFETISAKTLINYVNRENYIIVDLRDEDEYIKGHVDGAINIPYFKYEKNNHDIQIELNINLTNKQLIFYCDRGGISMKVARELSCIGYKTKTVVGGYNAIKAYKSRKY